MSRDSLFRREALENAKAKWLGQALLTSAYPAWVLVAITCGFMLTFFLVVTFCDFTRRASVAGEIITIPRAINVFSPAQGYIVDSLFRVGDRVKKGDALYYLDTSRTSTSGNVSKNNLDAVEKQLAALRAIIVKLESNKVETLNNLQNQLNENQNTYAELQEMMISAKKGMNEQKAIMQNYKQYKARGLVTTDQLNNQISLYYQQQGNYQNLSTQILQKNIQITSLKSELVTKAADFDNEILQKQYQTNELQRQLAEMDAAGTIFITAPTDGKIESLSVTEGQMVSPGDSLAQLIPANNKGYFLVLWLPNNSIPYVKPGDRINIRYEAFPYEKFGQFAGKIESISTIPASQQELNYYGNVPRTMQNMPVGPLYKVIVNINDDPRTKTLPLTNGMTAQATVFLEKRALYQWMLAPFYDIKKSLIGPVNE